MTKKEPHGWIIKDGAGRYLLYTARPDQKWAIYEVEHETMTAWEKLKTFDYECVPFIVEEIK